MISEDIMLKIEKKIVNIQEFILPKINPDSEHLLLAVILTDSNIDILKYYFDKSDYRWATKEAVSQSERYKPGNVLYLYEDGFVYYNELVDCKFKQFDETAIEYVLEL